MDKRFSRRDFLNFGGLAFSSLAFQPLLKLLPPQDQADPIGIGRVTVSEIGVYKKPDLKSERLQVRKRDQLLGLLRELTSRFGPPLNPRWYRVADGYVHSAYIQRVETASLNTPLRYIPKSGRLGEVTVPFTESMRRAEEYIRMHRHLIPQGLEQAGWQLTERSEDSLPFVR